MGAEPGRQWLFGVNFVMIWPSLEVRLSKPRGVILTAFSGCSPGDLQSTEEHLEKEA